MGDIDRTDAGPRRGQMRRRKRQMPDDQMRAFLRDRRVAHVGTVDADGWPYVVPLVYVYEGANILYLHTGALGGQFETNVRRDPRLCVEVADIGPLHAGQPYACNSALVYESVILFGRAIVVEDRAKKSWFFDRLLEKYGDAGWRFDQPGYPATDRIVLYEMTIEVATGKRSEGLYH